MPHPLSEDSHSQQHWLFSEW